MNHRTCTLKNIMETNNTRNETVPAVYIILEKEGEILLGKRKGTGYQDGNYNVPAGHIEGNELPQEAIIREVKEEIGIDLLPEDLEFVHFSYRPKHDQTGNRVDIFFRAKKWTGEIQNMEPHKCDHLMWVDPTKLPLNTTPQIRENIEKILKKITYSEFGEDFLRKHDLWKLLE